MRRGPLTFSVFPVDGRTAVAFERSGLSGVISGRRVSAATLVRLASWTGGGQIIF